MTLKTKFNVIRRVGLFGPPWVSMAVAFLAFGKGEESIAPWRIAVFLSAIFIATLWSFFGHKLLVKTYLKCPKCSTSIFYRASDMDGYANEGRGADNACHKCGQSFLD